MKIYTIKDIADLCDVGVSTVSRVLNNKPDVNDDTRQRVLKIIKECNYYQNDNAKHLKQRSTHNISIVVRGRKSLFLNDLTEKMLTYGKNFDYNFSTEYIDETYSEFDIAKRLYAERKIEGIIFLGGDPLGRREELEMMKLPCVYSTVSASEVNLDFVSSVCVDDNLGSKKAIDYLLDMGHTNIAVLGSPVTSMNTVGRRYQGVVDSFKEHGLEFLSSNYFESNFSFHSSYNAIKEIFTRQNNYTAIFAFSDIMAIGAAKAMLDSGKKIPDDISIVGYDGISLMSYYNPTLTTIRQPSDLIAKTSIDLIIDIIEKNISKQIVVDTEFIKGNSVKNINLD